MQTVSTKLSYLLYLYISVCLSLFPGVSIAECAVVVSRRSCGSLVICVCICRTQYVLFTLISMGWTHKKSCMTGNVLSKATLTISTLTAAMSYEGHTWLLLSSSSVTSLFLSFIFFSRCAPGIDLVCHPSLPPFPLCFPLSTPLIQLRESLTNAHASHTRDAFPLVWLFQCHHFSVCVLCQISGC